MTSCAPDSGFCGGDLRIFAGKYEFRLDGREFASLPLDYSLELRELESQHVLNCCQFRSYLHTTWLELMRLFDI